MFPHVAARVFVASAVLIFAFVGLGIGYHAAMAGIARQIHLWIADNLGWFYTGAVAVFPVFAVALAVSRYGDVRLGDPQEVSATYAPFDQRFPGPC